MDGRVVLWKGGVLASGGSPWRLARLSLPVAVVLRRASLAGAVGFEVAESEEAAVRALVDRGLLHPVPRRRAGPHSVRVVVPAFGRPSALSRCLASLTGHDVLVVDDATPDPACIEAVAQAHGLGFLRLAVNSGPGAARNAGAALCETELIGFVDSDCEVPAGWIDGLVAHFDDPKVAVVAPRIVPTGDRIESFLGRYERAASALDMGSRPALVRPGAALGFLPSAVMLVRRSALAGRGFDEALRLGEDVDLVWRLSDEGWLVRYEPSVVARHELRDDWATWLKRRFDYGTSAADLASRHPRRLAPLRVSPWNAATLALIVCGDPVAAAAVGATATVLFARRLSAVDGSPPMAASLLGQGLVADGVAIGHALRREYWPIGAIALAASPWSRSARLPAALMVAPVLWDWVRGGRVLDPARWTAVRLVADAAYGTGVLASAWRGRTSDPLRPAFRSAGSLGRARVLRLFRDVLPKR